MKDYTKYTQQGYEIIDIIDIDNRKVVVFKRNISMYGGSEDYNWGNYYDTSDGTWRHGHYCFSSKLEVYKAIAIFFNLVKTTEPYKEP